MGDLSPPRSGYINCSDRELGKPRPPFAKEVAFLQGILINSAHELGLENCQL